MVYTYPAFISIYSYKMQKACQLKNIDRYVYLKKDKKNSCIILGQLQ